MDDESIAAMAGYALDAIKKQEAEIKRLHTQAIQYGAVREILKEHGCTSDADVVHVPQLVESWIRGIEERLTTANNWRVVAENGEKEIERLNAELAEAHEAGKLSFSAGLSYEHADWLADIAKRDAHIATARALLREWKHADGYTHDWNDFEERVDEFLASD